MQVILFFFLTTFSCGFAQGKNHPESADNNLLAADVKKLPSAEESHVPEDCEEILRELSEERAKNRDLNQTISDILERMADMERDIIRNEEKIDQAQSSVVLLSKDVDDLTDEVVTVAEDVERNSANITIVQDDVVAVAEDVESLSSSDQHQEAQIKSLGARGTWCGYQNEWTAIGTITYDSLSFSDSNMNTGTPLNINSGNYSHMLLLSGY